MRVIEALHALALEADLPFCTRYFDPLWGGALAHEQAVLGALRRALLADAWKAPTRLALLPLGARGRGAVARAVREAHDHVAIVVALRYACKAGGLCAPLWRAFLAFLAPGHVPVAAIVAALEEVRAHALGGPRLALSAFRLEAIRRVEAIGRAETRVLSTSGVAGLGTSCKQTERRTEKQQAAG